MKSTTGATVPSAAEDMSLTRRPRLRSSPVERVGGHGFLGLK
ncbi:hypothetical protein ABT063_00675 [Streptomyces sp. NPDC002838]